MAKEEFEKTQPAGPKLGLTFEDTKGGDPAVAVQSYRSLTSQAKPLAVITYGSGVGMALSPLVNEDHVVQMGIATATPKYRSESDFTFRNFPSATAEAAFLAEALTREFKVSRVAIVNISNDYGVGTAAAFKAAFSERGGEVIAEEHYEPDLTDFKPLLLRLRSKQIENFYLASYPSDGALLLKQAHELGIKSHFYASVAIIGGKSFFSLAGDAAESLRVVSTALGESTPFTRAYSTRYPGESSAQQIYAARSYDAFMLIAGAAAACKPVTADCVKDKLFTVRNYHGASGEITFDSAGDIQSSFQLYAIHQKEFQPLHGNR